MDLSTMVPVPGAGDGLTRFALASLRSLSLVRSGAGFGFCAAVPVVGVIVCTPMPATSITLALPEIMSAPIYVRSAKLFPRFIGTILVNAESTCAPWPAGPARAGGLAIHWAYKSISCESRCFTSSLTGSATRRIALARRKSRTRNDPTFGCKNKSGAPCLSFSLMSECVTTNTVA